MKHAMRRLARRLVWSVTLVVGVASLAFVIARTLPGDPARMVLGPQASAADVARARTLYGLDAPLPAQFVRYWVRLVHLPSPSESHASCGAVGPIHVDLGTSYRSRKPVTALIAAKAPRSALLALVASLFQVAIGFGAATAAVQKRGRFLDQATVALTLFAVSAPTFILGLGLQFVLAHRLGWLPIDSAAGDAVALVLPALTLGVFGAAQSTRLAREELGRALDTEYVRAARARGASPLRALFVHAWRNALPSLATLAVLEFGGLVGGAIVTEKLFRWPGLGALTVDAVVNRDAPVLFGTVLVSAIAVAVASFVLEVVSVALDPRLRD